MKTALQGLELDLMMYTRRLEEAELEAKKASERIKDVQQAIDILKKSQKSKDI